MMKKLYIYSLATMAFLQSCSTKKNKIETMENTSIHQFKVEAIDGGVIDFSQFKGKKILIVNTASECGFTPQYKDLEALYQKYKSQLVIVGFPANNFGSQEPGNNESIAQFCQKNYGVTFPLAAKVSVKGDDMAPLFVFLCNKEQNGVKNTTVLWNFTKFLLDENGKLIDSYLSTTLPNSAAITQHLKTEN